MTALDFDQVIEQSHLALGEFAKGTPEPLKNIYSHREDVSLANPFGPAMRDGSRLLRPWSVPPRITGMVGSLASRT